MTSHCDDFVSALLRAADSAEGDASPALEAHLRDCTPCREALADQRAMRQALQPLAAVPVTSPVGAAVMEILRSEQAAANELWADLPDFRRWTWRLVPVAAALALAVAGATRTSAAPDTAPPAALVATEADGLPASATLVTGELPGDALLHLYLNATADTTIATTTGGGQ